MEAFARTYDEPLAKHMHGNAQVGAHNQEELLKWWSQGHRSGGTLLTMC